MTHCPVCDASSWSPVVTADEVNHEFQLQNDFVLSRMPANPAPEELKDLTDFMHGATAALTRCSGCGLVRRAEAKPEDAGSYEEDPNDPGVMAQVYPRYVQAFRNKEEAYRGLLPPRAEVLELGPHLGAFLQVAEEWNWNPTGIDVGKDTTEFMRHNGLTVVNGTIDDAGLEDGSQDGILIWNCFEQIEDPMATLRVAHRLLRPHGLLVVRVPNIAFYETLRSQPDKMLAYNNLLGFPYLYGYTLETLNRLLGRAGFQHVSSFNSELVTMPFADLTEQVVQEQHEVSREAAEASNHIGGPWIEAAYRRSDQQIQQPATPTSPSVGERFLERSVA